MAYMSQENKKEKTKKIREALKKFKNVKYTLSVRNHSSIELNIKSGNIDFIKNYNECVTQKPGKEAYSNKYMQVNTYWYKEQFTGEALEFIDKAMKVLNEGNFDHSDIQSDYFHVGWYVDINIGKWNKPYMLTND